MTSYDSVLRDLNEISSIARAILYSFPVNPELEELLKETAQEIDSQRVRAVCNPETLFKRG